jgi:hypothetical protein
MARDLIQLVVSIALIAVGLITALVLNVPGDMRVFGWVLVGVGVLGLVLRSVIARLRERG